MLSDIDVNKSIAIVTVSSAFFAVVTLLLIYQLFKLFQTARKGFGGEFQRELNQIKWHLLTFVITFTLRAIALWVGWLKKWPVFPKDYYYGQMNVTNSTVFVTQFILWNLIPIGYLSIIHYCNFKEDENIAPRVLPVRSTGSAVVFDETTSADDWKTTPKSSLVQPQSALDNSNLTIKAMYPS